MRSSLVWIGSKRGPPLMSFTSKRHRYCAIVCPASRGILRADRMLPIIGHPEPIALVLHGGSYSITAARLILFPCARASRAA